MTCKGKTWSRGVKRGFNVHVTTWKELMTHFLQLSIASITTYPIDCFPRQTRLLAGSINDVK